MTNDEMGQLECAIENITAVARNFGLDFYSMRYEVCPADIIYTIGAYGMPTRFSHWSFGKAFHREKMYYDFGLSKIYELVINSDPCYAFLLDGNSVLQNKLIVAHVLGHCDFFKNNAMFAGTARYMVESMSVSADRIRHYETQYGKAAVEEFLDAALGIHEHIDPSLVRDQIRRREQEEKEKERRGDYQPSTSKSSPYDDLWSIDESDPLNDKKGKETSTLLARPQKDLLLFLIEHSRTLEEWERDILSCMRDEMLYFWPQIQTKIMNEGWATYWHLRIMRELDLTESETIEFAKMHSGVVLPSRTSINPYHVGLKMWEDIEKRWNEPTDEEKEKYGRVPNQGREKMFEVREMESDVSFLRNYLTKELIEEMDLYVYQKVGNEWRVVEKNWEKIRDQLCASRANGGFPVIVVKDGDHQSNGELYLHHEYEGAELDVKYLEKTLPYVYRMWGRNVHIETVLEERHVLFSYDGKKVNRRFM